MSKEKNFVVDCLAQAVEEPARALVRLWLALREQGALEPGLNRFRCEADAKRPHRALQLGQPPPEVHPAAALRAVDELLAERNLVGQEPRDLRIDLSPGGPGSFFVVPRRPGWTSRLAAQPGHPEFWLRRHQVVPASHRGIAVGLARPPRRLLRLLEAAQIPFAAGGFIDGVLPDWESPPPFRCHGLTDPGRRWESVERLLVEAARQGAMVVILPELTVDADVRQRLRSWLRDSVTRFALVAAGSFHEDDSGEVRGSGPRRNVARVFDGFGDDLLCQAKLRPMRATPQGNPVDEEVEGGRRVSLITAPFGLVGLAICLDFCEIGAVPVADLWREVGPALMLVPSMGEDSTNHAHREKARPLEIQHGTVTLVASQHPESPEAAGLLFSGLGGEEGRPILYGRLSWTRG